MPLSFSACKARDKKAKQNLKTNGSSHCPEKYSTHILKIETAPPNKNTLADRTFFVSVKPSQRARRGGTLC